MSTPIPYQGLEVSKRDPTETSDYAAFSVLVYELPHDDPKETDRKIRSMLRRNQLGPFDPDRISLLRDVKNYLQRELGATNQPSTYFRGPTSDVASPEDFDQSGLLDELSRRYGTIDRTDLGRMISLALYVNYLR